MYISTVVDIAPIDMVEILVFSFESHDLDFKVNENIKCCICQDFWKIVQKIMFSCFIKYGFGVDLWKGYYEFSLETR